MLETELFELLEHTANAAYTVTIDGEICSWNQAAEVLLGYPADEVVGRNIDDVLKARDTMGTAALRGGDEAPTRSWTDFSGGVPNFDLEVKTRDSEALWVNVSTIVFNNTRTGRQLFARLMHDGWDQFPADVVKPFYDQIKSGWSGVVLPSLRRLATK